MANPFSLPTSPWARILFQIAGLERALRLFYRAFRSPSLAGELLSARAGLSRRPGDTEVEFEALGEPIVFLAALPWRYRPQRPQKLALALAGFGHPILYLDPFPRSWVQPLRYVEPVGRGVWRLSLRISGRPDIYRELLSENQVEAATKLLSAGLRRSPLAILAELPGWGPLAVRLKGVLGCPLVYDRLDLHSAFPGAPESVVDWERTLIRNADLTVASSPALAQLKPVRAGSTLVIRNAADFESLVAGGPGRPDPGDRPVAGYVGALSDWFDSDMIEFCASALPGWRFRLAGRVEAPKVQRLTRYGNVSLLGEIPHSEVGRFLRELDVALIPFRSHPLVDAVDPVKLYEALAVGLPVVARDFSGVAEWSEPFVYKYQTSQQAAALLLKAVEDDTLHTREARRRAVKHETWDRRAAALLEGIEGLRS